MRLTLSSLAVGPGQLRRIYLVGEASEASHRCSRCHSRVSADQAGRCWYVSNHSPRSGDLIHVSGTVIDYRNWHLALGRRFRSLKVWFVLRSYGVHGFQKHIREVSSPSHHVALHSLFPQPAGYRAEQVLRLAC